MTTALPARESLDAAESAMQAAMLDGDVPALNMLIDDELEFIGPDGERVTKSEDLEAHRTGATRFARISEVERSVTVSGECGTSELLADVILLTSTGPAPMRVRWHREWRYRSGRWVVVAGSIAPSA